MSGSHDEKVAILDAALNLIPPLVRKSLLNDRGFRDEYDIKTETVIVIGSSGVSFIKSELFDAVRNALSGEALTKLTDDKGRSWLLTNEVSESELPILVLSSDPLRLELPDFTGLSEDVSTRIRSLQESAEKVNLPLSSQEEWSQIIETRALDYHEVDIFHRDLHDTVVYVERAIRSEFESGKSRVSSLVPNSRRYFERLVGSYDGSRSIEKYAAGAGRKFLENLSEWRPYEGFLFALLLSSHSALTAEVNVENIDQEKLEDALEYLVKKGDTLSQLGALEVGMRILPDRPEVEPYLLQLLHLIRDDDLDDKASEFMLFSALFVLVDGELARTRLLSKEPPFYRRLCSLAQAALIHRQLAQSGIDYKHFSDWALSNRGEFFYMQSFADMRSEPRWHPELAAATHFQADFFGRIIIAGKNYQANLGDGELCNAILGNGEKSLIKLCEFPRPFLPGPLEGTENSASTLPDDFARVIEEQLASDEVEASSFIALVNSAMIFKIKSDHAELAAKALRLAEYRLNNLESNAQLVGILHGLATVAAVSRNSALADELQILVRSYRRDSYLSLSLDDATRISLVASASREELKEWREFAGILLTELAFSDFDDDEGKALHSHLSALMHSVPELWFSCARADAALRARCLN